MSDKNKTYEKRMKIMHAAAVRHGCALSFEEFAKPFDESEGDEKRAVALKKAQESGKQILTPNDIAEAKASLRELLRNEL